MSFDVSGIFRPDSNTLRQMLQDQVGGFEIPAYQRPYRWKPADLARLFEDVLNGIDRLAGDESALTFIGAVISVSGASSTHRTRPKEARQVIDGQQRLSTVLMTIAACHLALGARSGPVPLTEGVDEEVADWLNEQAVETRSRLFACLFEQRSVGDAGFQRLPKVVRQMPDVWSTKAAEARYISPLAHLLHKYITWVEDGASGAFTGDEPLANVTPEAPGASSEDRRNLWRRFDNIRGLLRDVERGQEGSIGRKIELYEVLRPTSHVLSSLFETQGLGDLHSQLRMLASGNAGVAGTIRLLLFSQFLLERVTLTSITARDESYAFDLFDSLNTTGEPLTAFETFVPLVVQKEGGDKYETSASYPHIALTSSLLAAHEQSIQSQTARLITSFLLAECGLKVSNRHNDQRRELRRSYESATTAQERRAMTQQLADTAQTYFGLFAEGSVGISDPAGDELHFGNEAQLVLKFLNSINHHIVVAPLSRYFPRVREQRDSTALAELEGLVLALGAYSILWRAAMGGAEGIDGRYRSLMQQLLARRTSLDSHEPRPVPSLNSVRDWIAASLADKHISDRDSWVARSSVRSIYEEQPELAKLLLLLASHHAQPAGSSGLTTTGTKSDSTDMLNVDRWSDPRYQTLEHVAPKSEPAHGWNPDIYSPPDGLVHRLGNLTLLPMQDNSALARRPWDEKRVIYQALAASTAVEAGQILSEATAAGMQMPEEQRERILEAQVYLPLLASVAVRDEGWDREFIELRGRHLLERAWDVLSRWLREGQ